MKRRFTAASAALLIFLFTYTGAGKLLRHHFFEVQLMVFPVLSPFHAFLSYTVPATELLIAALLVAPRTRRAGFLASAVLLTVFTGYLAAMQLFYTGLPCSCGGIIQQLSWPVHTALNILLVGLAGLNFYCNNRGMLKTCTTE